MQKLLIALMAIGLSASAVTAGPSQLERGVINGVKRLDPRIELPDLPGFDWAALKMILDAPEYSDSEKRSMVRTHLRKVEKFGTASGTVFGLFKIGPGSN